MSADAQQPDFVGELNFQDSSIERSLTATGKVYAVVDSVTGGFKEFVGTKAVPMQIPIYNGRLRDDLTLDTAGFQLARHPLPKLDYYNEQEVLTTYYDAVCAFVKEATGAYKVFAFDHVVRNTGVSMKYAVKDGVKVGGPALMVHGDYAMLGAPQRRDDFALPPSADDTFVKTHGQRPLIPAEELEQLKGRRFAIVNLWRGFIDAPIVDMPLTMCDSRTTKAEDYVCVQFNYDTHAHETYAGGHSEGQRWFYFPSMTSGEVVLLKTFDSQGNLWKDQPNYPAFHQNEPSIPVSSTLHSAVKDPRLGADYAKRESLEVRTIVFY
jgi:hypothetical protein